MRYFPEKPELFTENRRRFIEAMVEAGRAEAGRAPKSEGREWSGGPGREWSGRERREWSGGPGGGSGGNARKPDSGSGQGVADGRARGAGAGSGQEVADGQGGADGRARETGVGLGQGMADGPAGSSDGTTGPKAIAIFVSNDEVGSNADAHYPFRQNSDLYWLSGIWQEDTMLVLFPGHPDARYREVLVLTRPNELKEKWDGRRLRAEEARKISGIQTILWLDTIGSQLQQWIHMADSIYLNSNEHDRRTGPLLSREHR